MMDLRVSPCFVSALLLFLFVQVSWCQSSGPAYFVSSVKSFSLGDPVEYAVQSPAEFTGLVLSALDKAAAEEESSQQLPQALLVLASREHAQGSLSTGAEVVADQDDLAGLKELLGLAASSSVFTSLSRSCETVSFVDALLAAASGKEHSAKISEVTVGGSCADQPSKASQDHDVQSFIRSWAATVDSSKAGTSVLVFCLPEPPSRRDGDRTAGSASSSVVRQAFLALQEATPRFAAVFAPGSLSLSQERGIPCRRSLITASALAPPNATTPCGPTCKTKAALWEALFVSVVLLIAVISGLSCMVDLDTPNKFEAPPEAS